MPYVARTAGRLFVIRWQSSPTVQDLMALGRDVADVRQVAAAPIVYCAIIPEGVADVPEPRVRDAAMRMWPELLRHCESMHLVLLGSGVRQMLLRAAMRAMMATFGKGDRVLIHAGASSVALQALTTFGAEAPRARRALEDLAVEHAP